MDDGDLRGNRDGGSGNALKGAFADLGQIRRQGKRICGQHVHHALDGDAVPLGQGNNGPRRGGGGADFVTRLRKISESYKSFRFPADI